MVFRYFLLGLIMTFRFCVVLSQEIVEITSYTGDQGASHRAISSILKDDDGFMWFGTWNGINRFDGNTFKTFESFTSEKGVFPANRRVVQIADSRDKHHVLWMVTYDKQAYWFNKKTETFYSLSSEINRVLGKNVAITKIYQVKHGRVWLATEQNGVIVCNFENNAVKVHHLSQAHPSGTGIPSDEIHIVQLDKAGKAWIGTGRGIYSAQWSDDRWKTENMTSSRMEEAVTIAAQGAWGQAFVAGANKILLYPNGSRNAQELVLSPSKISALLFSRYGTSLYVTCTNGDLFNIDLTNGKSNRLLSHERSLLGLFEDSKGNLWIDRGFGVLYFERSNSRTTVFTPKYVERNIVVPFFCFEDVNNRVWISMRGGGFCYYDVESRAVKFSTEELESTRLDLPQYNSHLFYDNGGTVWFTSEERGLVKLVFPNTKFTYHNLALNDNRFLYDEVRSILNDSKGRLWTGTKNGNIYIRNGSGQFTAAFHDRRLAESGGVYSLLEGGEGTIWIGTKGAGLFAARVEGNGYRLEHFSALNKALSALQIYSMAIDRHQNIWIGTFDNGLFKLEQAFGTVKVRKVNWKNLPKGYRTFSKIRHIMLDGEDNLWMATTEGVVVRNSEGVCRYFYDNPPADVVLGDNDIQHIFSDLNGRIYLCTSGAGLTKFEGKPFGKFKFTNYGVQQGLQNGYITSGIADDTGVLWLATEGGLVNYDSKIDRFFNLESSVGLRSAAFSEKVVCSSPTKDIFWGTRSGVLQFKSKDLIARREAPNVVFTKLLVNSEERNVADAQEYHDIQYLDQLYLAHNENNLSIDFAITDYQSTQHYFSYRLLGLDTLWQQNGSLNRATFTNLKPGEYTFEIRADDNFYSSMPFRRLTIIVASPWWATWWAYALYFALAATLFFFIRHAVKSIWLLKQKVALQKKLGELKMQFFTNVSHELRTPLTLILSPAERLATNSALDGDQRQYVELITRNAQRMQHFVDQLLSLRQVQEGKYRLNRTAVATNAMLMQVVSGFELLAREKAVNLEVSIPEKEVVLHVDKDSVEIILYNLLSNAIKYTKANSVVKILVEVSTNGQALEIAVMDDGPGVSDEELDAIFELFYIGSSDTYTGKKSGIGLHFVKELITLHGGTVRARNLVHAGLEVRFTLPLERVEEELVSNDFFVKKTSLLVDTPIVNLGQLSVDMPEERPLLLLVEDNMELRTYLESELSKHYRVAKAENGKDAFTMATEQLPELILSDLMMPVMDGIALLKVLRADDRTSHIPVILLTAKHGMDTQISSLNLGADLYITKPFHLEFLLVSIRNLLRSRQHLFKRMVKQRDLLISQDHAKITDHDRDFLKQVIALVEEKMLDPELNIDSLADALNLGRNTFYKKFKSLTNLAPVEFVRDMRLEKSKIMLDQGNSNISEVAYSVGFNNPKYFSTCFKEKFGVSPKNYLLQHRDH
ncbi:hybrid sensor histidine kinase/response regulator transcription factor [Sphingobacterium deserti]|uniref:histidine kinase n=1 Tax=Sphingobacterium deserti TaxID=1229276 RepID=A0A0B8TCE3_9SPHI|nr:hybrid sensor histidine kinase/response regulator transcription factor [Sphingobacterium deserti]KGE16060.1 two component transcriptional regulator, AraC family [Sphingobacterium deserti]